MAIYICRAFTNYHEQSINYLPLVAFFHWLFIFLTSYGFCIPRKKKSMLHRTHHHPYNNVNTSLDHTEWIRSSNLSPDFCKQLDHCQHGFLLPKSQVPYRRWLQDLRCPEPLWLQVSDVLHSELLWVDSAPQKLSQCWSSYLQQFGGCCFYRSLLFSDTFHTCEWSVQLLGHDSEVRRNFSHHFSQITEFKSICGCTSVHQQTWDRKPRIRLFPEMPSTVTFFSEILCYLVLSHPISTLLECWCGEYSHQYPSTLYTRNAEYFEKRR